MLKIITVPVLCLMKPASFYSFFSLNYSLLFAWKKVKRDVWRNKLKLPDLWMKHGIYSLLQQQQPNSTIEKTAFFCCCISFVLFCLFFFQFYLVALKEAGGSSGTLKRIRREKNVLCTPLAIHFSFLV